MNDPFPRFPPGKAAIFNGQGKPFEFITRPIPFIKPGEILVKTLYTTLCGSDIHTYCGRRIEPPHVVLGHEIVGDILWIDPTHPGTDFRGEPITIGDRITWSIFSVPAGITPPRPDMPQKSASLFKYGHVLAEGEDVFNGGLADYCILRSNTALIKISASIPLKVAATISCAHSTVMGALRVAGDIAGKKVLVFGAGLLGLSCVAMCREAGAAQIGIVDPDTTRLAWGEKFGADAAFTFPESAASTSREPTTAASHEPTTSASHGATSPPLPWPEADIIFDMTGNPQAMKLGVDSLAVGGCAIWIGAVYPAQPVPVDAQMLVRKLLQIRGLHNYNYQDFVKATVFIEKNYRRYPFETLIEKEYHLDDIEEAFTFASINKPVRVGIKI
ncbi:MAG TPA: zinc-binding dehydrogenase [Puia sp.]|nr:zinc-binding dehydrogenase [Puia sp.]